MTPLCITCMCGRIDVARVFMEGMQRIRVPVLSIGDCMEDYMLVREYDGWGRNPWTFSLGAKFNFALKMALSIDYNWTHLIIMGDDDILSDEYMAEVERNAHHPFLGVHQMYMIEPHTRRAIHFRYENNMIAIGAGRVFKREVIDRLGGEMFDESLNKELDRIADGKLFEHGYMPHILDKNREPLLLGIKTAKNIWPFSKFENEKAVDYDTVVCMMGEEERRNLLKLEFTKEEASKELEAGRMTLCDYTEIFLKP